MNPVDGLDFGTTSISETWTKDAEVSVKMVANMPDTPMTTTVKLAVMSPYNAQFGPQFSVQVTAQGSFKDESFESWRRNRPWHGWHHHDEHHHSGEDTRKISFGSSDSSVEA